MNTSSITLEPVDCALDVKPLFVHHKLDRIVQLQTSSLLHGVGIDVLLYRRKVHCQRLASRE